MTGELDPSLVEPRLDRPVTVPLFASDLASATWARHHMP